MMLLDDIVRLNRTSASASYELAMPCLWKKCVFVCVCVWEMQEGEQCPRKRCQLDSFMHVFVPWIFHQNMHKSAFVLQQMWIMSCSLKTVYSETSSWEMHYPIISVTGTFTDTNYTSSIAIFSCGMWHVAFILIASRTWVCVRCNLHHLFKCT